MINFGRLILLVLRNLYHINAAIHSLQSSHTLFLYVLLVYQIYHHLHHHILLIRLALGNHQGQGNKGVVGKSFCVVCSIENVVVVGELKEEGGGNALVAIAKGMVLGHKI